MLRLYFETVFGDVENEDDKEIKIDEDFNLRIVSQQMAVFFKCEYALNINVNSQKFHYQARNSKNIRLRRKFFKNLHNIHPYQ